MNNKDCLPRGLNKLAADYFNPVEMARPSFGSSAFEAFPGVGPLMSTFHKAVTRPALENAYGSISSLPETAKRLINSGSSSVSGLLNRASNTGRRAGQIAGEPITQKEIAKSKIENQQTMINAAEAPKNILSESNAPSNKPMPSNKPYIVRAGQGRDAVAKQLGLSRSDFDKQFKGTLTPGQVFNKDAGGNLTSQRFSSFKGTKDLGGLTKEDFSLAKKQFDKGVSGFKNLQAGRASAASGLGGSLPNPDINTPKLNTTNSTSTETVTSKPAATGYNTTARLKELYPSRETPSGVNWNAAQAARR